MIKNPFSKQELHIIGNRLKNLRLSRYKDLTYREFEDIIKISYSRISDLETGQIMPSINDLYNYQRLFNVSYDYLLGKIETKNPLEYINLKYLGLSDKSMRNLENLGISKYTGLDCCLPEEFPWFDSDSINLVLENKDILNKLAEYIGFYTKENNFDDILYSKDDFKARNIDLEKILKEITLNELVTQLNKLQEIIKTKKEHYNKKHYK